MRSKSVIITTLLIMFVVIGCKIPKEFLGDLKSTPNPLELKGGKINCDVQGTFPAKYFHKNMVLTVTPVLKSKTTGDVIKGEPKVFQGEKVKGNNKTVSFKNGGKYEQTAVFDYDAKFDQCELYMEATAQIKKKTINFEPVKVADGLITTANLIYSNPDELGSKLMQDKFQKSIEQKEESEIKFLIQQSNIRTAEAKTLEKLTKDIQTVKKDTNSNVIVKGLAISSYASPDGGVELNEKLAEARENSTKKYVDSQMKKLKSQIDVTGNFTAQDWEGFKVLMEKSDIQDKTVILNVLSMYQDPEQREKEIKNLSSAFTEIKEQILPQLRRSKLILTKEIVGKSDEQLQKIAAENPSSLSVEELLYTATLNPNLNYKKSIYQKVVELYPEDVRTYNNLGVVEYQLGNIDAAHSNFTKALAKDKNNALANMNMGSILLAKGNIKEAQTYLGNAGGAGNELNLLNGAVAIANGDYKKAVAQYGNSNTNNAALAYILNNDYSKARNILENISTPNAKTYYLQSIVAARTNDAKALVQAVTNTINADNSYKERFLTNPEFTAFLSNAAFSQIFK